MTVTTVPDVDLEQWLKGEIERPCESYVDWAAGCRDQCGRPASWLMSMTCCFTRSRFACEPCKERCDELTPLCIHCDAEITVTWTERIR